MYSFLLRLQNDRTDVAKSLETKNAVITVADYQSFSREYRQHAIC